MESKKINIIWRDIDSSTLKTIHYSSDGKKTYLGVKFTNEYAYIYSGVPLTEVFQMIMSDSSGGYFSKVIRTKYPYKHIGRIDSDSPLVKIGIREDGNWDSL